MKNTILTLFFLFFLGILNAQKLITPIENQERLFNEEERKAFEEFSKPEISKDLNWVKLSNITEAIDEEGYISFSLPNREEYRMKLTRSEFSDENNFVYAAQREEEDGEPTGDDLVIVNVGGYISASIQVGDEFFRIIPITPKTQILVKSGPEMPNWCGTQDNDGLSEKIEEECSENVAGCTSKIMIVVDKFKDTQAFLSKNAIYSFCKLLIEELNTTFKNSKINHRCELVWVEFMNNYIFFDANDCTSIASMQQVYFVMPSSPISSIRKQVNPDIVVFLSESDHFSVCGKLGKSKSIKAANSSEAFSIVKLSSALTDKTFTHEVGHLFGGRHDDDNSDLPARAIYLKGNSMGTVMTYAKTPISYFSNPDVTVSKEIIGAKDRNNACIIRNYGCKIAALTKDDACNFSLNGTFDKSCNPTKLEVNVVLNPPFENKCVKNVTFSYEYSVDGVTFTKVNNTTGLKCTIPLKANTKNYTVFIRVEVSSGAGLIGGTKPFDHIYASFSTTCK